MLSLPAIFLSFILPINIWGKPIYFPKPAVLQQTTFKPPPTPTKAPIPTSVSKPTFIPLTPTPTSKPLPTSTPIPTSPPVDSNNIRDYMINEINNFRRSKGLSIVQTDSYTCSFADIRAKEITTNFSHDGFNKRISSKTLPYPSYTQVVENLARVGDYKEVVNLWINSPGHNTNLSAGTPFGCVGYSGDFYSYQGWKP